MGLLGCTTRPASGKLISAGRKKKRLFFFPHINRFMGSSDKKNDQKKIKRKMNRQKCKKEKKSRNYFLAYFLFFYFSEGTVYVRCHQSFFQCHQSFIVVRDLVTNARDLVTNAIFSEIKYCINYKMLTFKFCLKVYYITLAMLVRRI